MAKPWEDTDFWKNESAFYTWVSYTARKSGWASHPVKLEYIKQNRIKVPNPNPRGRKPTVWGMTCAECGGDFPLHIPKDTRDKIKKLTGEEVICIEIDHLTPAGPLKTKEDIGPSLTRLYYVTLSDLEGVCKTCHKIRTYMQTNNCSKEHALVMQEVLSIQKEHPKASQLKEYLKDKGFSDEEVKNGKERRKSLIKYVEGLHADKVV